MILFYRLTPLNRSMLGHWLDALLGLAGLFGLMVAVAKVSTSVPLFVALALAFANAYTLVPPRYLGGTFGQRLCGVRVVTLQGTALSWAHVLKRAGMQWLELVLMTVTGPFGFIALWLYQSKHERWPHDSIARTRVVWARDVKATITLPAAGSHRW